MMLRDQLRLLPALVLVATSGAYACSSDADDKGIVEEQSPTTSTNDGGGTPVPPGRSDVDGNKPDAAPPETPAPSLPFTCEGGKTIAAGLNEGWDIAGKKRSFYVDFPTDTSKPAAVMFSWHGFGDNAEDFHKNINFDPNTDPNVPVMIVTPADTGFLPPNGLAWDIAKGKAEANVDVALFETVLGCLQAQQKIDTARIYEFGFSAGAVMTNLVYSRHPNLIAAIVSESGAWMNDKAQRGIVNLPVSWDWPELVPADRGNVLLTHGGKSDVTVLNILDLEKSAQFAIPFLKAAQRTVVDCPHDAGHKPHQKLLQPLIMKYLFSHRLGQPSPFANGGAFEGYPEGCKVLLP